MGMREKGTGPGAAGNDPIQTVHHTGGGEKRMRFVPLNKQSKKQQKAYYARSRGSWNGVRPCTRAMDSKKRHAERQKDAWAALRQDGE